MPKYRVRLNKLTASGALGSAVLDITTEAAAEETLAKAVTALAGQQPVPAPAPAPQPAPTPAQSPPNVPASLALSGSITPLAHEQQRLTAGEWPMVYVGGGNSRMDANGMIEFVCKPGDKRPNGVDGEYVERTQFDGYPGTYNAGTPFKITDHLYQECLIEPVQNITTGGIPWIVLMEWHHDQMSLGGPVSVAFGMNAGASTVSMLHRETPAKPLRGSPQLSFRSGVNHFREFLHFHPQYGYHVLYWNGVKVWEVKDSRIGYPSETLPQWPMFGIYRGPSANTSVIRFSKPVVRRMPTHPWA